MPADSRLTGVQVGGRSAGGGLSAALCQLLRDRGGHQPMFQLLIYPMLDHRSAEGPPTAMDGMHRIWDRASNARGWGSYLRGHDPAAPPPYAVPALAADLAGLPPAWIGVGTLDLFCDEDMAYGRRLAAAGVAVETEEVAGAFHGFDDCVPAANVACAFRDAQVAALRRALAK